MTFRNEKINTQILNYNNCTEKEIEILNILKENPNKTQIQLAKELGVSRRTIINIMSKLKEKGKIQRIGSDKKGYWKLL